MVKTWIYYKMLSFTDILFINNGSIVSLSFFFLYFTFLGHFYQVVFHSLAIKFYKASCPECVGMH